MSTRCFFLTPTGRVRLDLRRFTPSDTRPCPSRGSWGCDASATVGVEPGDGRGKIRDADARFPPDDPRWPATCAACGRAFEPTDTYQVRDELLYARSDGGPETTLRDAPPGAMWDAEWLHDVPSFRKGEDGRILVVRLPNRRDWVIDSRASNCTLPTDTVHRCWVRHGQAPDITVDKNGHTCGAGAGSILAGDWHGFLRNGALEPC